MPDNYIIELLLWGYVIF